MRHCSNAFTDSRLALPQVALSSMNAGMIKPYVRTGWELLADTAYDLQRDADLVCLPADHLLL